MRIYDQVAVVIPASNERSSLPGCLSATLTAALCVPIPVVMVVVLDASEDGSAELAGQYGPDVHFVSVDVRNVGAARAVGFGYARSLYDHGSECWYATTDADSRVEPGWLVRQLEAGADMVLGRACEAEGEHIHGADMGFSARAYWRVGGFHSLSSGEDIDLVTRFEAAGYHVHRDTDLSVITPVRARSRAPRVFAHPLGDHRLDESRRTATGGNA